jgi:geranylgeranyl diphosphate synthase type I/geranylgeranyl diphosphate synthase type II
VGTATSDAAAGGQAALRSDYSASFVDDLGALVGEHYMHWFPFCREAVLAAVTAYGGPAQLRASAELAAGECSPEAVERAWGNVLRAYLQRSGKMLRPYIVCLCLDAYGRDPRDWPNQVAMAEIIHSSSLILDDIVDDSFFRRGGPTAHQVIGAQVAGDAASGWLNVVFDILHDDRERLGLGVAAQILEQITWEHAVTGFGQVLDVGWALLGTGRRSVSQYLQQVVHRSTSYTYRMPFKIGALTARAPRADVEALSVYAERLGIAFQIIDDLLNVKPLDAHWGKETAEDLAQGKFTIPVIIALERGTAAQRARLREILDARTHDQVVLAEAVAILQHTGAFTECTTMAEKFIDDAKQCAAGLSMPAVHRERLCAFADYVVRRQR